MVATVSTRVYRADGRAVAWQAIADEYTLVLVRGDDFAWTTVVPRAVTNRYRDQRKSEAEAALPVLQAKLRFDNRWLAPDADGESADDAFLRLGRDHRTDADLADADHLRRYAPDVFPSVARCWLAITPKQKTFYRVVDGHIEPISAAPDLVVAVSHQTLLDALVATYFGGALPAVAPRERAESKITVTSDAWKVRALLNVTDYVRYELTIYVGLSLIDFAEEARPTRRAKFRGRHTWRARLDGDRIGGDFEGRSSFTTMPVDAAVVMTQLFDASRGALARLLARGVGRRPGT